MNRAVEEIMKRDNVDYEYAYSMIRETADEIAVNSEDSVEILKEYLKLDASYLYDVIIA